MEDESQRQRQQELTNAPAHTTGLGEEDASVPPPSDLYSSGTPQIHDYASFPIQQTGMNYPNEPSTFDLRNVAGALPDYSYGNYPQTQHQISFSPSAGQNPNFVYPYQRQPYPAPTASSYGMHFNQQLSQSPAQQRIYSGHPISHSGTTSQQSFPGQMYFPQHQQAQSPSHHSAYTQFSQPGAYGPPFSSQYSRMSTSSQVPQVRIDTMTGMPIHQQPESPGIRRSNSPSSMQASSALRGPPRKPKQSGYALWVGNLPPGAQITDLKDHFSRDATDDIESVFLISKSNCAFVNYKTEQSCAAAMTRFHDSRFQSVRLVCRLRRGSTSASSSTTPVMPNQSAEQAEKLESSVQEGDDPQEVVLQPKSEEKSAGEKIDKVKEKFFIVKSLTVEDLERSVQSGIWATQSHNEENLNKAYKAAEDVYLIFSANKSGEYFGYARMDSDIDAEAAATVKVQAPEKRNIPARGPASADVPLTIPTPATATAPRGQIIDDSARGTIFWEAISESLTPQASTEGAVESGDTSGDDTASATTQQTTFGKPFKITWLSTERLPFYRTRGLRNPWNANREVKIARDGTELEPSVGRRLIGMFSQQAQINAAARGAAQQQYNLAQQQQQQIPYQGYGYGPQGQNNPYGRPF